MSDRRGGGVGDFFPAQSRGRGERSRQTANPCGGQQSASVRVLSPTSVAGFEIASTDTLDTVRYSRSHESLLFMATELGPTSPTALARRRCLRSTLSAHPIFTLRSPSPQNLASLASTTVWTGRCSLAWPAQSRLLSLSDFPRTLARSPRWLRLRNNRPHRPCPGPPASLLLLLVVPSTSHIST